MIMRARLRRLLTVTSLGKKTIGCKKDIIAPAQREDSEKKLLSMLDWDVNNGISRRAWARNDGAIFAIKRAMDENPKLTVTLPTIADDTLIDSVYSGDE